MISPERLKRGVNLLIFGTVGAIVFSILLTFSLEQHYSNYQLLNKDDYLDGSVSSVRTYRDSLYFVVNEAKYSLGFAQSEGQESSLEGFVLEGDSLSKQANSDSVLIKRNGSTYLYILNTPKSTKKSIAQMNKSIQTIIDNLGLQPHPEGGYYKETYRSTGAIPASDLPVEYSGDRNFSTSIYYLLVSEKPSAFHKINQDEIWHFYDGSPIELHTISESGEHQQFLIGRDFAKGQVPQLVVPANHWFASKVTETDSYSLVGCTVAPGFDFEDFTLAKREDLIARFPRHRELILEFTN